MKDDAWWDAYGGLTHVHANIWRSPMPFLPGHFKTLREAGIRVVFSMEEAVPGPLAEHEGLDWRPHFWTDHAPPHPRQLDAFLDDYATVPRDAPVVVHCRAGWGRAGTAITSALVREHGMSARDALRTFWARVPGAERYMSLTGQADFVHGFAARLVGRGIG